MNESIDAKVERLMDLANSICSGYEYGGADNAILNFKTTLRTELTNIKKPEPAAWHIKLVPIRQLFDDSGNQVCDLGTETCHFYVTERDLVGGSCNHCQRGIPDNKPHRLCPVIHERAT